MGIIVAARARVGVEMIRRLYVAKRLKLCLPTTIVNDVGLFVTLVEEMSGLLVGPAESEPVCMLPEGQDMGGRTWYHTGLWGM